MKSTVLNKWLVPLTFIAATLTAPAALAFSFDDVKLPKIDLPKLPGGGWKSGVPIEIVKGAKFPEVAALKKIAVVNFSGPDGPGFTASLRDELSSATINGQKVFTISGTLGIDGRANIANMVAAAKNKGLDAVYFGQTNFTSNRSASWREENVCTKKSVFGQCKDKYKVTSNCWNVEGGYVANLIVVRVKDGSTIYEETKNEVSAQKHCSAYTTPAPDPRVLATSAKDTVLAQIRDEIIPRTEAYHVKLKKSTKGMSKDDAKRFKGAVKFAKKGRFDRACGTWEELYEKNETNAKHITVLYNLGVCSEYQGDYQTALNMYRTADGLVTSPDDTIYEAITRVEAAQNASDR